MQLSAVCLSTVEQVSFPTLSGECLSLSVNVQDKTMTAFMCNLARVKLSNKFSYTVVLAEVTQIFCRETMPILGHDDVVVVQLEKIIGLASTA
jgi:hypothetical protein